MRADKVNVFVSLIRRGRVRNLQQLKQAYRALVMKSHPDAVGSNRLVERYLSLSSDYESAKVLLASGEGAPMLREAKRPSSHRLAYFQTIYKLEMIDKPYSFHRNENKDVIAKAKEAAYLHFSKWKGECKEEYLQAEKEYDEIKAEKPRGPYMKEALALNVSPIFHNIIAYHLTGVGFYRAQVKQNLSAVMQHLGRRKLFSLRDYILMLIHDMENGPAAFVGDAKRLRIME